MKREKPQQTLLQIAQAQHGLVTVRDAREAGVEPVRLRQMAGRGVFQRVSRGVYRATNTPPTQMTPYLEAVLWPQVDEAYLSHETALDVHDLCDVNPNHIDITVPRAHRVRRRVPPDRYRLHHRNLDDLDTTYVDGVPIVTPAQAIVDGIEIALRQSLIRQAMDTLRRRQELSLNDERRIFRAMDKESAYS